MSKRKTKQRPPRTCPGCGATAKELAWHLRRAGYASAPFGGLKRCRHAWHGKTGWFA